MCVVNDAGLGGCMVGMGVWISSECVLVHGSMWSSGALPVLGQALPGTKGEPWQMFVGALPNVWLGPAFVPAFRQVT